MSKKRVPVSVIIPCYRCVDTIERAVASVVAQTRPPQELILVDDASPDGTLDVLKKLRSRIGSEWVKIIALQENSGPSVARNTGWDAATQPYIAFLDADDSWHPKKLEIQYGWMAENPSVALTGHPCIWVRSQLPDSGLPEDWQAKRIRPLLLLLSNRFPTRSVMLHRDLPYRFEPQKRHSEDYLLWLQIALDGHQVRRLELPLAYLYKAPFGEGGLSAELWKMEKGQLDTFFRLRSEGRLGWITTLAISVYSLLKYLRRLIIVYVRKY